MDEITQNAVDFDSRGKMYVLVEFPYPSGERLSLGHAFSFIGTDIYARYQRMLGKNVLFPMGWDAFGLPTENYALRTGRKPQNVTRENIETFHFQMDSLGLSFDWPREVNTTDPSYYRWTQWIFIQLFKHGLTEKKEMPINWCPKDKIGLANEEVIKGRCERCGTEVTRRLMSQWVVRITDYADRLLEGLQATQFIEKVKLAQINWIGRREGANITFPVEGVSEKLEIFTTRPDTLWGATFMVIAPEHPLAGYAADTAGVADYLSKAITKSERERTELIREKTGVFSGLYAVNPGSGERIPIWISDFVLMGYGTGAVMSVPAHDQRDYDFARRFNLPIKPVIQPAVSWSYAEGAYEALEGSLVNSPPIDGLQVKDAIPAVIDWLSRQGLGKGSVTYHLRDWIFSRQHYWGEPIPLVYCEQCGWQPVPEDQLPVVLPVVEKYQPTDTGESPLANITEWVNTACPNCGGPARRETDTMPNWAGSNWYFLRFTDPHNDNALADMEKLRYWLPVDIYIGGDEHNVLHLLYSRFIYQFLNDLGYVPSEIPEPYARRISHGVIIGEDGKRMSKTRGNVIVPDEIINRYGADAARVYLMFLGPFDATISWSERAMTGVKRFLDRFGWLIKTRSEQPAISSTHIHPIVNLLVKQIGEDILALKFNTAVAKMMEALNSIIDENVPLSREDLNTLTQVIAPFAPFMAERCWGWLSLPGSVHISTWPTVDESLLTQQYVTISIQVNGKLRGTLEIDPDTAEKEIVDRARQVDSVARFIKDHIEKKVIYVPRRTVNFVVS